MTMTAAPRTRKARAVEPAETPLPDELVPTPAVEPRPPAPVVEQTLEQIPTSLIAPNRANPRSDLGDLEGLADSIQAVGILEPLVVERYTGSLNAPPYALLAGHRRLAAAVLAGVPEVPCLVRASTATDAQRMEMALVENLQREGLPPLDEAAGYRELTRLGLSQTAIAQRVGCSQGHVSKRLALLELPSPVQARITKGTLPLEAAAALVKLKDHPDKLKKAAGEDPSAIVAAVERAERVIAWEAKRAELVEVAKGRGWAIVDEPRSHWEKHSFATLATWGYQPRELELDVRKHEDEPCHAVMIPGDPHNLYAPEPPKATSVCTDPGRHKPKGASTLKAKVEPKAKPDARHAEIDAKRAKDAVERKAAAGARTAVLVQAVADHRNTRGRSSTPLSLILASVVDQALDFGDGDTVAIAAELLGLATPGPDADQPHDDHDDFAALDAYAAKGDHELHRSALAVTLAGVEGVLRHPWGRYEGDRVARHFAYLAELGYQPSPWEQAKLDEAAKRRDDD